MRMAKVDDVAGRRIPMFTGSSPKEYMLSGGQSILGRVVRIPCYRTGTDEQEQEQEQETLLTPYIQILIRSLVLPFSVKQKTNKK